MSEFIFQKVMGDWEDWEKPKSSFLKSDRVDRNGPCPCGSNQKAKKCKECGGTGCPPAHRLSKEQYIAQVNSLIGPERTKRVIDLNYHQSHTIPYWDTQAITVQCAADCLIQLLGYENETNN